MSRSWRASTCARLWFFADGPTMATVLITQCLQRDFVDPIGPHDPLPNLVLPPPVRLLFPLLIDRPYKKYAATLRTGT